MELLAIAACPIKETRTVKTNNLVIKWSVDNCGWFLDVYEGWPDRYMIQQYFKTSAVFSSGQRELLSL